MQRAAREFPDTPGYEKFSGAWTLETVYADKIPMQTDLWSCGQRVLLLADMLVSGVQVSELGMMYSDASQFCV